MSSWFVKRRAKKTILESCCDNWAKYKRFAHSCLWACEPLFCVGVLSVVALGSIAIVKDVWIKSQNASHSNRTKHAKGREKKTTTHDIHGYVALCVCFFPFISLSFCVASFQCKHPNDSTVKIVLALRMMSDFVPVGPTVAIYFLLFSDCSALSVNWFCILFSRQEASSP